MGNTTSTDEIRQEDTAARALHKGLAGSDVRQVQEKLDLINRAFNFHPNARLESSGTFGSNTLNFVIAFQRFCGLPESGRIEGATREAIEREYAKSLSVAGDGLFLDF